MVTDGNFSSAAKEYLDELWKENQDRFESEEDFRRTVALWPICPACGRRRAVRCPVCGRVSDLCPPADDEFWDGVGIVPAPSEPSQESPCQCSCSCLGRNCPEEDDPKSVTAPFFQENPVSLSLTDPSSSADSETISDGQDRSDPDPNRVWHIAESENSPTGGHFAAASDSVFTAKTFSVSSPNYHRSKMTTLDMVPGQEEVFEKLTRKFSKHGLPLVLCPTCDEPFVPSYFSSCQECGYLFESNTASDQECEEPQEGDAYEETPELRVLFVAGGILLFTIFFVLFLIYFVK